MPLCMDGAQTEPLESFGNAADTKRLDKPDSGRQDLTCENVHARDADIPPTGSEAAFSWRLPATRSAPAKVSGISAVSRAARPPPRPRRRGGRTSPASA